MQSTSRSDIDAMHRTIARESDPWKKMLLIYDYCHDLQSSDPRLCIRLAREGLSIARRFGDHIKIARGYLHLGFAHALLTKQAEAIRAFLAAERHFGKAGERKGQGIALTNLMLLYDRRKGGGKALEIGKQALEIFEALESERHIATVLEAMAQIHIGKGHYGVGLEMGLRALRIWDGIGGGGNALKMRMLVVGIYKDIDENQTALRYAEEALEECRGTGSLEEASLLGTIGILRSEMGELAAGIELLGQGLSLALAGDHPSYGRPRCMALAGLAQAYGMMGDADRALDYCARAIVDAELLDDIGMLPNVLLAAAALHRRLGWYDEAECYMQRVLAMEDSGLDEPYRYRAHDAMSALCEAKGDAARALEHFKIATEIRDTMRRREVQYEIADMRSRLELERERKEREVAVMKSHQLEREVGHKMNELAAVDLSLKLRDELLDRLKKTIVAGVNANGKDRVLRTLLEEIAAVESTPRDHRAFRHDLERSQWEFNQALIARFPELTPAELRICVLLRGNMSTKEIADLLSVTTRNVETHRYHIRRKMKLPKDASLITFLASL